MEEEMEEEEEEGKHGVRCATDKTEYRYLSLWY